MEVIDFSETSVNIRITPRYVPEYGSIRLGNFSYFGLEIISCHCECSTLLDLIDPYALILVSKSRIGTYHSNIRLVAY
jgi:hypothetical protein